MKLKDGFVAYNTDDTHILVPTGGQEFRGLVRSNKTAAFIIELLAEETDRESIVDAMVKKYGIDRDLADRDVGRILQQLRDIQALEE